MRVKSAHYPVIVPATYEDWKRKHIYNPESKPVIHSHFTKRGKAPSLYLRHYNHNFNPEPKKVNEVIKFIEEIKEIPNNIVLEYKRHITPLFAWA